ncbi:periplasmic heavy metal sensor [Betaproteobacteria bacterium SCN2]|jgi:Spy/CpxP family protein refolding chaperone|nr:periplasmic heavy metal sensor [Betaproteobacteria bacterium SCN2]
MKMNYAIWVGLWVLLTVVIGYFAFFRGPMGMGYGAWHGWGWGDRLSYENSPYPAYRSRTWQGMQPGRMGGWAPDDGRYAERNYGMMGPFGGTGPGMAFGMPGYGMMPRALPELTPEQSQQIEQLQAEQFERSRTLMQQAWQAQAQLNELYGTDKRDWNAIRAASQALFALQRQQMDVAIELQQKIDGLLTDEQRKLMARAWHGYGWMRAQ